MGLCQKIQSDFARVDGACWNIYIIDMMVTSLLYMCDWTIPTSDLWLVGMSHG